MRRLFYYPAVGGSTCAHPFDTFLALARFPGVTRVTSRACVEQRQPQVLLHVARESRGEAHGDGGGDV